jgi:hypothetical protein
MAIDVAFALLFPICPVRLGLDASITTAVHMPETPVNEYHLAMSRKNKIGTAGQVASMQPKSKAQTVNQSPHDDFRQGVLRADSRHAM